MPASQPPPPQSHQHHHSTYLNCAAPKSVLTQNCQFVRQLQLELPPYPSDVGVYSTTHAQRPSTLDVAPAAPAPATVLGPRHPSILKHYKSCPVSPVREELDWSNLAASQAAAAVASAADARPARTLPVPMAAAGPAAHKRHSMYSDDAQTILDMIHSDTERMIAEITQKYGDLDEYDPIRKSTSAMELKPQIAPKPTVIPPPPPATLAVGPPPPAAARRKHKQHEHGFLSDDDEHFSSDSLEDCSLDIDHPLVAAATAPRAACRKHARRPAAPTAPPTRSVSDYFVHEQPSAFGQPLNPNRNVSLSDILNETGHVQTIAEQQQLMGAQRHSSASFFLGPPPSEMRKSQESLLSDDNISAMGAGGSYCNSMESILSDESECKSAPLEALFGRPVRLPRQYPLVAAAAAPVPYYDTTSKSYGSSPNAGSSGFDFYMLQQQQQRRYADADLRQPAVAHNLDMAGNGAGYPWITNATAAVAADEFIPRLGQSGRSMVVSKSLSKEFADHRLQNSTNPMCEEPPRTAAPPATASFAARPTKRMDAVLNDPSVYVMRKSCSFDIEMFDGRRTQRSAARKYEQNLEKFELERRCRPGQPGGGTLAMEYVPHKPPVATRRSSSMRNRQRRSATAAAPAPEKAADKEARYSRGGGGDDGRTGGEKSFEIYVAEKGAAEDMDSVDSLEFYAKPRDLHASGHSVDSLDGGQVTGAVTAAPSNSVVSAEFLTPAEYSKFRDIERQIDVINKLVELEERKLEQERLEKERRLQPFRCDIKQKGYVKSLTMNFDKLARREEASRRMRDNVDDEEEEDDARRRRQMKRNFSLPDVLEGAKFRTFCDGAAGTDGGERGGERSAEREQVDEEGGRSDRLCGQRMGFREGLQQQ